MPRNTALICCLLTLAGCAGDGGEAPAETLPPASEGPAPQAPSAVLQPIPLAASDVEQFLAATRDLQQLGLRAEATQMTEALQANAEALAVLQRHGFDVPRFQQVAYSVMMAAAAQNDPRMAAGATMRQPEGNVELVARYREEIEALSRGKPRP
jgi:hypothetical protein